MFPLWLANIILLFFVWLLIVKKLINILYYYDYVTISHLILLHYDWSTEK